MYFRLPKFLFALVLVAQGLAWGESEADLQVDKNTTMIVNESKRGETPTAPAVALRRALPGPSNEHAPLAWFSLGSLAVGGVFYAINTGIDRENVAYTAGDRTRFSTTVAVAGISALLAAGSYFFYTNRSPSHTETADDGLETEVSGGLDGEGGASVSAKLTVPLAFVPGFR